MSGASDRIITGVYEGFFLLGWGILIMLIMALQFKCFSPKKVDIDKRFSQLVFYMGTLLASIGLYLLVESRDDILLALLLLF